jgi:hypothetical protein
MDGLLIRQLIRFRICRKIEKSFDIISEQRLILENPYIKEYQWHSSNFRSIKKSILCPKVFE